MTTITGTDGNDRLDGTTNDDTIIGGLGNDVLRGDEGTDTAVFSGLLSNYTWGPGNGGSLVVDGPDGSDKLYDIEVLAFDDYTFSLNGENAPHMDAVPTVYTDAVTPVTFTAMGYDLDDPSFRIEPDTGQRGIFQRNLTVTPILDGRISETTFEITPTMLDLEHLAEGETTTLSYALKYGGSERYKAFVDVVVTGVNDAPQLGAIYDELEAVEDGGAVSMNLTPYGSDIDSDDGPKTLSYEIVSRPTGVNAWIEGRTLYYDPGSKFQTMVANEFRTFSVEVRAIDSHDAVSNTSTVKIVVEGANDPLPNYINAGGGVRYGALGVDPSSATYYPIISGEGTDPDPALYRTFTGGKDITVFRAEQVEKFIPYNGMALDTRGGFDRTVFRLTGQEARIEDVDLSQGTGEDVTVVDIDGQRSVRVHDLDISTGDHSDQILVRIDSGGSVIFENNGLSTGGGNDIVDVVISATGGGGDFWLSETWRSIYSLGTGNDTLNIDLNVVDEGEFVFRDAIYGGAGNDRVEIDNRDSRISTGFYGSGHKGFAGVVFLDDGNDVLRFRMTADSDQSGRVFGGKGIDTIYLLGSLSSWSVDEIAGNQYVLTRNGQTVDITDVERIIAGGEDFFIFNSAGIGNDSRPRLRRSDQRPRRQRSDRGRRRSRLDLRGCGTGLDLRRQRQRHDLRRRRR